MKFRITFLTGLLCFTAISSANAAQLEVDNNIALPSSNQSYDNNTGSGIYSTGSGGTVTATHRITANKNTAAGVTASTGILAIHGNTNNSLVANENATNGIEVNTGAEISISNINIEADYNQANGISASANSNLFINGNASGVNIIHASNNGLAGISSNNSAIDINGMDIELRFNTDGLSATNGGSIRYEGVDAGSNVLISNSNNIGLFVDNSGLDISKVDVRASDNASHGIEVTNNSTALFVGSGGRINRILAESNGEAAIHAANNSIVSISNMDIFTSRNGSGILSENGGQVIIDTNSGPTTLLDMRGNTTSSIEADGANSLVSIKGSHIITDRYVERNHVGEIIFEATQQFGLVASNSGTVKVEGFPERNDLALNHSQTAGLGAYGGLLDITNMNIYATRNILAKVVQGGTLNLSNSDVHMQDSNTGIIADNGNAVINFDNINFMRDPEVTGGLWNFLEVQGTANALFTANNSHFVGSILTDDSATSTVNLNNSSWQTGGGAIVSNLNLDNSTIDMRGDGTYGAELIVNNLASTGDNNTIQMETHMEGNNSWGDKITINNSSTGKLTLDIDAQGTGGTPLEGILIVDNKAGDKGADFRLKHGLVETGAFNYGLVQEDGNGAGDLWSWYLRATGYSDIMNTMINIPDITMSIARAGMGSLSRRVGELRADDCNSVQGLWVRNYNRLMSVDYQTKSEMNLYGLEVGYDHQLEIEGPDRLYVGVMVGYTALEDIKSKKNTATKDGEGDGYAPSIGAYATWLNSNGYFMDAAIRSFWADLDITNYTVSGMPIKYSPSRMITAASFEAGRKTRRFIDPYSSFVAEPKIGVMLAYGASDSSHVNGYEFSYDSTISLIGRMSLMLGYQTPIGNDAVLEPYVELGVFNEFMGDTDISYASAKYKADPSGIGYDAALGINAYIGQHTSLFGTLGYEKSKKHDSFVTNLGMRYSW